MFVDDARELAQAHGTPLYVHQLEKVAHRVQEIRNAFGSVESFQLLFATMANPTAQLLTYLNRHSVGACVNSVMHMQAALRAGIPPSRIQFTSSGVSRADMDAIASAGVAFNADSVQQAVEWTVRSRQSSCGLRINAWSVDNDGVLEKPDRMGTDSRELGACIEQVGSAGGRIAGLHIYVGTNYQEAERMLSVLQHFYAVAQTVPGLEYVNIGGGIGVDYAGTSDPFELPQFGRALSQAHDRLQSALGRQVRLVFEPGRGLVADCGVFLVSVTDVKTLRGERFVAVDGSVAVFPRPLHHPEAPHRVEKLDVPRTAHTAPAVIVGRTTFSKDILASCLLPPDIEVGDLLVFRDSGAYCHSMRSAFLGQSEPAVLFQ